MANYCAPRNWLKRYVFQHLRNLVRRFLVATRFVDREGAEKFTQRPRDSNVRVIGERRVCST